MNCLGNQHEYKCHHEGHHIYPEEISKKVKADNATGNANDMTAEIGPGLCCRCNGDPKQEDGRAPKRGQKDRGGRGIYKP